MRQLGVRLKTVSSDAPASVIFSHGQAELIDVETGQAFTGVTFLSVSYGVNQAIEVTVKLYPTFVDGADKSEISDEGL